MAKKKSEAYKAQHECASAHKLAVDGAVASILKAYDSKRKDFTYGGGSYFLYMERDPATKPSHAYVPIVDGTVVSVPLQGCDFGLTLELFESPLVKMGEALPTGIKMYVAFTVRSTAKERWRVDVANGMGAYDALIAGHRDACKKWHAAASVSHPGCLGPGSAHAVAVTELRSYFLWCVDYVNEDPEYGGHATILGQHAALGIPPRRGSVMKASCPRFDPRDLAAYSLEACRTITYRDMVQLIDDLGLGLYIRHLTQQGLDISSVTSDLNKPKYGKNRKQNKR